MTINKNLTLSCKRLSADSIRDSIQIRIVAANSIRDSIRMEIFNSQVSTVKLKCAGDLSIMAVDPMWLRGPEPHNI